MAKLRAKFSIDPDDEITPKDIQSTVIDVEDGLIFLDNGNVQQQEVNIEEDKINEKDKGNDGDKVDVLEDGLIFLDNGNVQRQEVNIEEDKINEKDKGNDGDKVDVLEDGLIFLDKESDKDIVKQVKKEKDKISRQERLDHVLEDGKWMGYSVGKSLIWTVYLWIESFTPLWMSKLRVRANIYNSYFVSELIIESWPQLVTNLVNAYYKGFSVISNISAAFSVMMISYIMLKIIYYVGIQGKGLDKIVL
eukprot:520739_1